MRSSACKRLDMARSILPSKSRHWAADALATAKGNSRRRLNQQLRSVADAGVVDPGDVDDCLDPYDPWAYPTRIIRQIVRRRRGADKLNHFERWAVAVTRHVRVEDRLSYMRGLLPEGLIGEHALGHLERLPEFDVESGRWRWTPPRPTDHDRSAHRVFLLDALANGEHRGLNVALKRAPHSGVVRSLAPHTARCLLGRHDVEAFLDDLYACAVPYRETHPEWLATVRRLAVRQQRGPGVRPSP
ncbi:MAG: hypothetical protein ACRD12_23935 [Acidimicrobiales bacterium]